MDVLVVLSNLPSPPGKLPVEEFEFCMFLKKQSGEYDYASQMVVLQTNGPIQLMVSYNKCHNYPPQMNKRAD